MSYCKNKALKTPKELRDDKKNVKPNFLPLSRAAYPIHFAFSGLGDIWTFYFRTFLRCPYFHPHSWKFLQLVKLFTSAEHALS